MPLEVATHKKCPGPCNRPPLPREAFRKDKGRYDGMDSYCKKCRADQAKAKRPQESARWRRRRLRLAAEGKVPSEVPKEKLYARIYARNAHPNKKRCVIPGCANRGERHHYLGYAREHWTDIIFLCRKHHAQQHVLERARKRTGPTYT